MSLKNRDEHNRWRNKTVAFRVSPEEDKQIETYVRLSGLMLMYGKVSQENYVELTAASAIPNKEIKSPQILRY